MTLIPISKVGSTVVDAEKVIILDGNGDQVTSFGGGTQYTEGDTDSTISGPAIMWEDTGDTLRAVSAAKPLPVVQTGTPSLPTGAATAARQDTGNTSLASIDTKVPALGQALAAASVPVVLTAAQLTTLTPPAAITGFATETTLGSVKTAVETIDNFISGSRGLVTEDNSAAIKTSVELIDNAISGAGFNITQQGGVAISLNTGVRDAGTQRVTIATNDVVPVTDNSGTLTVDAPVGTPVFVRLSDGAAAISTLPVSLASVPSHAVTVASGGIASGAVASGAFASGAVASGAYASGSLASGAVVDITNVSTPVTPATATATKAINLGAEYRSTLPTWTNTQQGALQVGTRGSLHTELWNTDSATPVPSGSGNATGALRVELANNGTGQLSTVSTVTTVSTLTTLTGGGVAHDGGDSGNPIKIGLKAETSPKGITTVADGDRTNWYADSDGMAMVKLNTSFGDLVSERVTDTGGTSTAFSNFSAVASTRNYVTSITVYNSSATAGFVDIRDGTAGSVLWTMPLPAGGGAILSSASPLFRSSANTALAYDVSAALSTVYISMSGFQSKV